MAEKIERLPITDDYIFKRVFAYEGNENIKRKSQQNLQN